MPDLASLVMRRIGWGRGSMFLSNALRFRYKQRLPRLKAIQIETLGFCNYSCSFCPTNQIAMPKGRMPTELYEKILSQLADFDGEIRLYLRNEPLLDKRLEQFVRAARERTKATILLQTNGSLLTEAAAAKLTPWTRIVVNDYSADGSVRARIAPFADKYGIVMIDRSSPKGLTNRAGNLPGSDETDLKAFCVRPFEQLYIAYDGRAVLCCQDWVLEEVMGDLTTQSVEEVWMSAAYVAKREALLRKERTGLCAKCDFPGV
jgi:MoaA/NifB/PqqE/SkfB family radical SAM enzyme